MLHGEAINIVSLRAFIRILLFYGIYLEYDLLRPLAVKIVFLWS